MPARARLGIGARSWRFVKRHALTAYAVLAVAYLMLPIAVVILFSFNHPTGRFNYVWNGFTFDNWINWNSVLGIQARIVTSLEVGGARRRLVGDGARHADRAGASSATASSAAAATNLLVFLPMSTPEIVLGASLLTLFLNRRRRSSSASGRSSSPT